MMSTLDYPDFRPDDEEAFEGEPEALDLSPGERRLVTQPYDYSVDQLVAHVEKGKILLIDVPYQREYVWDDAKASRLIESLLLNVPIPVCYFAENEDGTWEVVDGLQRSQSIVRFFHGEFPLKGLLVIPEYNGLTFKDLPSRDQRRIESRTLRFVVVTNESHPDIKFDVFERLNTGAVKLTPQELRNCIYRGTFNDGLADLTKNADFRTALGRDKDSRKRDEELVLRFLALVSDLPGYKPPLTQYLNEYMRTNRGLAPASHLVRLFEESMLAIRTVLEKPFQMQRGGKLTSNLNRALYDAVSVSVAFSDRDEFMRRHEAVRAGHWKLISDEDFAPLVGRATADRSRMHGRITRYVEMLEEVGVPTHLPHLPEA